MEIGLAVAEIMFFEFLGAFVMFDLLRLGKEVMAPDDLSVSMPVAAILTGVVTIGRLLCGPRGAIPPSRHPMKVTPKSGQL